jgi:hypothetical protein
MSDGRATPPTDRMVEAATAAHVAAFAKLPRNPSPQEAEQYAKQAMRVALTAALKVAP